MFVIVQVWVPPFTTTTPEQLSYVVVYPETAGSVIVYVPALIVISFWPSASNDTGLPLPILKVKSFAPSVPPLSLTTTFLTINVPAWSLFVIVQVWVPPFTTTTPEQLSYVVSYPLTVFSTIVYVPVGTVISLIPSVSKVISDPSFTLKLKSPLFNVPPLSFVNSFTTLKVPVSLVLVKVQTRFWPEETDILWLSTGP